jgi:hypothetical protein
MSNFRPLPPTDLSSGGGNMRRVSQEELVERFEDRLDDVLREHFGGMLPHRCRYCGRYAAVTDWPGAVDAGPLRCPECDSTDVATDVTSAEFAEDHPQFFPPPDRDDNPVEDEQFWTRLDWIRRRR